MEEDPITQTPVTAKTVTIDNVTHAIEDTLARASKADLTLLAPAYSASATYAEGDYCTYEGALYRCSTAVATAEEWTAAHWTAVTLTGELGGQQAGSAVTLRSWRRNTVTLHLSVNDSQYGSVDVNGISDTGSGARVPVDDTGTAHATLTATPAASYIIDKWQTSADGSAWTDVTGETGDTLTLSLPTDEDRHYRAVFKLGYVNVTFHTTYRPYEVSDGYIIEDTWPSITLNGESLSFSYNDDNGRYEATAQVPVGAENRLTGGNVHYYSEWSESKTMYWDTPSADGVEFHTNDEEPLYGDATRTYTFTLTADTTVQMDLTSGYGF